MPLRQALHATHTEVTPPFLPYLLLHCFTLGLKFPDSPSHCVNRTYYSCPQMLFIQQAYLLNAFNGSVGSLEELYVLSELIYEHYSFCMSHGNAHRWRKMTVFKSESLTHLLIRFVQKRIKFLVSSSVINESLNHSLK